MTKRKNPGKAWINISLDDNPPREPDVVDLISESDTDTSATDFDAETPANSKAADNDDVIVISSNSQSNANSAKSKRAIIQGKIAGDGNKRNPCLKDISSTANNASVRHKDATSTAREESGDDDEIVPGSQESAKSKSGNSEELEIQSTNPSTPSPLPASKSKNAIKRKKQVVSSSGSENHGPHPSSSKQKQRKKNENRQGARVRRNLRLRSNTSRTSRAVHSSSSSSKDSDSDDESRSFVPSKSKRRRKTSSSAKKNKIISEDDSSDDGGSPPPKVKKQTRKKNSKKTCKKNLRSTAERKSSDTGRKQKLLKKLQLKMEEKKNKEAQKKNAVPEKKKASPPPTKDSSDLDSDFQPSSDSESGLESPCPIVSEGSDVAAENSDFNGSSSTPSSSSVTSEGETDEVPDLDSGSEGEKELEKEEEEEMRATGQNEEQSDRTSSSSEDEQPDDGQNDTRCSLCKNLGSGNFDGRAIQENTDWCKCGECSVLSIYAGDYDLICCKEIEKVAGFIEEEIDDECVTKHPRFNEDVLKNHGYARAISKHCNMGLYQGGGPNLFEYSYSRNAERERKKNRALAEFKTSSFESKYWQCLRSFKYWIFDCERDQMVIPACVHHKILDTYFIPEERFIKFSAKSKCPTGRHCRLANI